MRVALLANLKKNAPTWPGMSPDQWDDLDSEETIEAILKGLFVGGHVAEFFEADLSLIESLPGYKPDICFNIAESHWGDSRESHVPALLAMLRQPYTGSGVLTLALTLDKPMTKRALAFHDLPTPAFQVFERAGEPEQILAHLDGEPGHNDRGDDLMGTPVLLQISGDGAVDTARNDRPQKREDDNDKAVQVLAEVCDPKCRDHSREKLAGAADVEIAHESGHRGDDRGSYGFGFRLAESRDRLMKLLLVGGTDTGVGKTIVTAALASQAKAAGRRVAVVKPAQTGVTAGEPGDMDEVRRLSGVDDVHELARYAEPLAPATAAALEDGAGITVDEITAAINALEDRDLVIVEGAGGVLVRFSDSGETCLLYTSDAADDHLCVGLGGRRIL